MKLIVKTVLLIILIVFPGSSLLSQKKEKNCIYFKAAKINITNYKNYGKPNQEIFTSKVLGIDVQIKIDTIFNKYTITYEDDLHSDTRMVFLFFKDVGADPKSSDKFLLAELSTDNYWLIIDLLRSSNQLKIISQKKADENFTNIVEIKETFETENAAAIR